MPTTIDVHHDFTLPVERVYAYLAEHENLGPLFGAKVERVRDGETERNGVGSVRKLRLGPTPPFEETVTQAVPNELIEYRITKGSPLKNHRGTMRFSPRAGGGSQLHYTIEFDGKVPGVAPVVKMGLERALRKGLPKVDEQA